MLFSTLRPIFNNARHPSVCKSIQYALFASSPERIQVDIRTVRGAMRIGNPPGYQYNLLLETQIHDAPGKSIIDGFAGASHVLFQFSTGYLRLAEGLAL